MKVLALLAAAASLTGCVAYPYAADPYYGGGPVYQRAPYAVQPAPTVVIQGDLRHGPGYGRRRDRDGDGVPDRYDARPYIPRRY